MELNFLSAEDGAKAAAQAFSLVESLTDKQRQVFFLMCGYWATYDRIPSMAEVATRMGYRSKNSAVDVASALVKKGVLERLSAHRLRFGRVSGVRIAAFFIVGKTKVLT